MLKNYFLIAYKVYMRRKLFTAINLLCITLTLVVLLVMTAMLQSRFYPTGVEGKSALFLQTKNIFQDGKGSSSGVLGYKVIDQYLRKMSSVSMVAGVTLNMPATIYQTDRATEVLLRRADAPYWKILDFNVLVGRVPDEDDVRLGRFVATINQSTANKLFGNIQVVGKRINVSGQQFEVIGVVEDVNQLNAYADIWVPVTTSPNSNYREQTHGNFMALLMAKDTAGLTKIQDEIRDVAKQIDRDYPKKGQVTFLFADSKLAYEARYRYGRYRTPDAGEGKMLASLLATMLLFMSLPTLNLINLNAGMLTPTEN